MVLEAKSGQTALVTRATGRITELMARENSFISTVMYTKALG